MKKEVIHLINIKKNQFMSICGGYYSEKINDLKLTQNFKNVNCNNCLRKFEKPVTKTKYVQIPIGFKFDKITINKNFVNINFNKISEKII